MSDRDRWVSLRQKYVQLFDGDMYSALVLEALMRWQKYADDNARDGDWFYRSARSIARDDLFGAASKSTVYDRLMELQGQDYLEREDSDDEQSPPYWRVDVQAVNADLPVGVSVDGYAVQQTEGRVREKDTGVLEEDTGVLEKNRGVRKKDTGGGSKARACEHESTQESEHDADDIVDTREPPPRAEPPDSDHHHQGKTPDVVKEAAEACTSKGAVQELAEKYRGVGVDRDNLPQRKRISHQKMEEKLHGVFGNMNFSTPPWIEKIRVLITRFTEEELDEALEQTAIHADNPSFSYLCTVLDSLDEPHDDGSSDGPVGPELIPDYY